MGTPLSPEQTKRLEEYQAKWLRIALSTETINPSQATAAVKNAYRINGFKEPQIHLCGSPYAGMQKLVELANELDDLGEGLNQEIQLNNEWVVSNQAEVSEYNSAEIIRPLDHILYLFRPLENHLEKILLYRPKSAQPEYPLPQPGNSAEDPLELYAQFMEDACAMPPSLFNNRVSTDTLADAYCRWDFGFSVLNWAHSAEQWAASAALLESCGWVMPFEKVCVICDRPSKILVDDRQRLHAVGEPALAFRDGYSIYVQHGALLEDDRTSVVMPVDYLNEQQPQLRQAIIEQTSADDLPVDWLFQEPNWQVRQTLLEKLAQQQLTPTLQVDTLGLPHTLCVQDLGPDLWLVHGVLENCDHPHIQQAITTVHSFKGTTEEKLYKLSKNLLIGGLERIVTWLEENSPSGFTAFLPGLEPETVSTKLGALPCRVSQEVHDLYQWHNGMVEGLEQMLFVYHDFMSLDRAIEFFEYLNDDELQRFRQRDGEPQYFFPIFDFEGEYFAVVGSATVASTAPVYHITKHLDCSLAFNSLTAMIQTIAEAYESGDYTIDSDGQVEWSGTQLLWEIARRYNADPNGKLFFYQ
jgi:hypothetical protein